MRSRRSARDQVAAVARRRLELLGAELAALRPESAALPGEALGEGPGEPPVGPVSASVDTGPAGLQGDAPPAGRHARRSVGRSAAVIGWLQDRLPPTLQGRVQIGASHLTVVAVMVAAALAVTAWWALRAGAGEVTVPAVAPVETPLVAVSSPSVSPSDSASPAGTLVVDVAGKVRRPGIATLPAGSRVVDALEAAGGARRGVDIGSLNLARLLVDGEQIVVGIPAPPGTAASAAAAPGASPGPLVDINTADQAALESLPGVGPVTAEAILRWRTENGAFTAVDELLEVSGIGEATLAEMAPFVTL
jgi:competence protein ComEA